MAPLAASHVGDGIRPVPRESGVALPSVGISELYLSFMLVTRPEPRPLVGIDSGDRTLAHCTILSQSSARPDDAARPADDCVMQDDLPTGSCHSLLSLTSRVRRVLPHQAVD